MLRECNSAAKNKGQSDQIKSVITLLKYIICMHNVIIFWKLASLQKGLCFYVSDKTICSEVKYVIMDCFYE